MQPDEWRSANDERLADSKPLEDLLKAASAQRLTQWHEMMSVWQGHS